MVGERASFSPVLLAHDQLGFGVGSGKNEDARNAQQTVKEGDLLWIPRRAEKGHAGGKAVNGDSMSNPEAMGYFLDLAEKLGRQT